MIPVEDEEMNRAGQRPKVQRHKVALFQGIMMNVNKGTSETGNGLSALPLPYTCGVCLPV